MEVARVQAIASITKGMDTIPSEYIHSESERPAATTLHGVVLQVPVIDLSDVDANEGKIVKEIAKASKEWGIFQVINHGIPNEVIANLQKVGKEFFEELPQEEKEFIAKNPRSQSIEGYGTSLQKEVEGKKGWVDHLFHKIWPPSAINYCYWPKNPPSYREANEEYAKRLREVVDKMFKSLSLGLGLEAHEMMEAAGGEDIVYLLKINYYPPCPRPDLALGVVAHTDMSYITLLVPNEVQGLQVFKDGHWYDVNYITNALIVHIGDQVEILSNGEYKSVYHRTTVNKDKIRMSWPIFLEPPSEHKVGPIPKLVNEANPPKFKTKKYKDYVYCKLNKLPQ
ncbi:Flavonol synthase/flavanone 3-hydroxylase [Capsicum annuum]|uniref:Flavonol synthase/flavanone 3-hydroxylase n=1 Tax=Capsicum annuum TaxID=4072 RepID=A0A1U8GK86_CAPAN|nr:flavonol synthase/flavanone 3-hydroxylase [Capsicum annuum]KAF3637917.1 Flavonol synthase/flavanone 3-hydroxylase [Capsicum annuum]KAF3638625.1 Flavonol synthase/flavanone 3-hydroxylase [Capsicum annuum]PHT83364.1 Flavonol synthase/flavanone 3-hydroxylase [Capsicum annuum]